MKKKQKGSFFYKTSCRSEPEIRVQDFKVLKIIITSTTSQLTLAKGLSSLQYYDSKPRAAQAEAQGQDVYYPMDPRADLAQTVVAEMAGLVCHRTYINPTYLIHAHQKQASYNSIKLQLS